MKRIAQITTAAALSISLTALAAMAGNVDTPQAAPLPSAPAPAISAAWDRRFAGGSIGFGQGEYSIGEINNYQAGPDVPIEGAVLAARFGRTWQKGNAVYGFDASIGTGPSGSVPIGTTGTAYQCNTGICLVNIDALASVRGLYGRAVGDTGLIYGAAGLSVGAVSGGIENSPQYGESTATGFTVGIGYERVMTERMSLYTEVNYYDLGDLAFGTFGANNTFGGAGDFATITIGANYKF